MMHIPAGNEYHLILTLLGSSLVKWGEHKGAKSLIQSYNNNMIQLAAMTVD